MLLMLAISFYSSRKILNGLGIVDYGISNVVAGFLSLFLMVSDSLSSAISRFLNVYLTKHDSNTLRKIFSSSIILQITTSVAFVILAETVGLWFLQNKLNIPFERRYACNVIYQLSIISFVINLLYIPFNAVIVAHEKMTVFAYVSIAEALLKLSVALLIYISPIDKLIWFTLLCLASTFLITLIYTTYCSKHFTECKPPFCLDINIIKELFSFSGWNFIGSLSVILRVHGGNILLNIFFGTTINAAKGIANQINSTLHGFVSNFMIALNPQIVKKCATKNYKQMEDLVCKGAKFSFFIFMFFAIPLILEAHFFLSLWLGVVPDHSVLFVQLIILYTLMDTIGGPLVTAIMATGKIRNFYIIYGFLESLNLPITYYLFKSGYFPEIITIVNIIILQCSLVLKIITLHKLTKFPISIYLKKVYIKVFLVFVCVCTPLLLIRDYLEDNWVRFVLTILFTSLLSLFSIWFLGCSNGERAFIRSKIINTKTKYFNKHYV